MLFNCNYLLFELFKIQQKNTPVGGAPAVIPALICIIPYLVTELIIQQKVFIRL